MKLSVNLSFSREEIDFLKRCVTAYKFLISKSELIYNGDEPAFCDNILEVLNMAEDAE